jgi:hypothetical protein
VNRDDKQGNRRYDNLEDILIRVETLMKRRGISSNSVGSDTDLFKKSFQN